jgi:5-methylthioadenosine/S-adenosylhomocysteine deaminase
VGHRLPSAVMRQRFTTRAVVVGDRAGTVVPMPCWTSTTGRSPGSALPRRRRTSTTPRWCHCLASSRRGWSTPTRTRRWCCSAARARGLPWTGGCSEVMWPAGGRLTPDDVEVAMTAHRRSAGQRVTTSVEMYFHPERIAAPSAPRRPGRDRPRRISAPGMPPLADSCGTPFRLPRARADGHRRVGWARSRLHRAAAVLRDARRGPRARPAPALHVAETPPRGPTCSQPTGCRCRRCSPPPPTCAAGSGCWRALRAHGRRRPRAVARVRRRPWRTAPPATRSSPAGIAPLRAMLDAASGGLGTDGPGVNDGLDLFADMRWPRRSPGWPGASATALTAPRRSGWRPAAAATRSVAPDPRGSWRRAPSRSRARGQPGTWRSTASATRPTCCAPGVVGRRPVRARRVGRWPAGSSGGRHQVDAAALRSEVVARRGPRWRPASGTPEFLQPIG